MLGFEDHGILTCWLYLDYGGSSQGFGGYCLGGDYGTDFLKKILNTVQVEEWEDLIGKYIRVKFNDKTTGFGSNIEAIGNIIEDKWFSPKELGKKYFPEESK